MDRSVLSSVSAERCFLKSWVQYLKQTLYEQLPSVCAYPHLKGSRFAANDLGQWLALPHKAHGQRVHTMARVFRSKPLSMKHMPEMASTILAENLDAAAIGICHLAHGTLNFIVKTRPSTKGLKLILTL